MFGHILVFRPGLTCAYAISYYVRAHPFLPTWPDLPTHLDAVYSQFFTVHEPPPARFQTWINEHMAWVEEQVKAGTGNDLYWEAVGAILAQLRGVTAGYNAAAPATEKLTYMDMLIQNLDGDMESLHSAVLGGRTQTQEMMRALGLGHPNQTEVGYKCSALVRLVPSAGTSNDEGTADAGTFSQLFFGHDTWDTYSSMVRMYVHSGQDVKSLKRGERVRRG